MEDVAQTARSVEAGSAKGEEVYAMAKNLLIDKRIAGSIKNTILTFGAECTSDPDVPKLDDNAVEVLVSLKSNVRGGKLVGERQERVLARLKLEESLLQEQLACLRATEARSTNEPVIPSVSAAVEKELGSNGVFPWRQEKYERPPPFLPEDIGDPL